MKGQRLDRVVKNFRIYTLKTRLPKISKDTNLLLEKS